MPKLQTFNGPELDAVLAKVRREAGPDATIAAATKIRSGGIGGFFSKQAFRVTVKIPDAPAAPVAPAPEHLTPPPVSIFELADLVDEAEADAVTVHTPAPAPVAPPAVVFEPTMRPPAYVPSTERPTFNAVLHRIATEAGAPQPEAVAVAAPLEAPSRRTLSAAPARVLLELGLPETMLPADMSPGMAVAALLRSLDLPAVPPLPGQAGAVTVVVGERRAAARLAADVAAELHLSKSDVWIAEPGPERPGRLVSAADAAAERRSWAGAPTVVALTAPAGSRDLRWAEEMLDALEPTAVWGTVGADRKCEDIEAWAQSLGGFDALALEHLESTVSPASVLRLGIPVARLEGQKATPALWAVLLAERIAA